MQLDSGQCDAVGQENEKGTKAGSILVFCLQSLQSDALPTEL